MKGKRRIFSVFIAFCIIFTLMPVGASASDGSAQQLYWFYSTNCSLDSDGRVNTGGESAIQTITIDRTSGGR